MSGCGGLNAFLVLVLQDDAAQNLFVRGLFRIKRQILVEDFYEEQERCALCGVKDNALSRWDADNAVVRANGLSPTCRIRSGAPQGQAYLWYAAGYAMNATKEECRYTPLREVYGSLQSALL